MKRLYWTAVTFWRVRQAVNQRMPGASRRDRATAMRLTLEEILRR